MADRSDPHDGQPSNAPPAGDRGGDAARRTDPIPDDLAGIDPVRYGALGVGTFGALAVGWFLFAFVMAGLNDPVFLSDGPIGLTMREPDDLFVGVSNAYTLLVHVGPLLGVLLGLVVGQSADTRTPAAVTGAVAVTVGAAMVLFVLSLLYVLTYSNAVDLVTLLEPAFASALAIAVACIGSAASIGVFESLEES
jgi:hypothetical protein